jgi:hypothetical protein
VARGQSSGAGVIELKVESLASLFDPLDPFPVPTRDLSRTAEEFIVEWARELPPATPIEIILHVPTTAAHEAIDLQAAFTNHFGQRAKSVRGDISELFRVGRTSLAIGLATLVACVLGAQGAGLALGNSPAARILSEGLIILGWVANWRPVEIFLYDWWPLARRRRLYQRLSDARIELQSASR